MCRHRRRDCDRPGNLSWPRGLFISTWTIFRNGAARVGGLMRAGNAFMNRNLIIGAVIAIAIFALASAIFLSNTQIADPGPGQVNDENEAVQPSLPSAPPPAN